MRFFLRPIDIQGLLPKGIDSNLNEINWRGADLGSILDFNLISIFGGFDVGLGKKLDVGMVDWLKYS